MAITTKKIHKYASMIIFLFIKVFYKTLCIINKLCGKIEILSSVITILLQTMETLETKYYQF